MLVRAQPWTDPAAGFLLKQQDLVDHLQMQQHHHHLQYQEALLQLPLSLLRELLHINMLPIVITIAHSLHCTVQHHPVQHQPVQHQPVQHQPACSAAACSAAA